MITAKNPKMKRRGISIAARTDALVHDGSRLDFSPANKNEMHDIATAMIVCRDFFYGKKDSEEAGKALAFLKGKLNTKPTPCLVEALKDLEKILKAV